MRQLLSPSTDGVFFLDLTVTTDAELVVPPHRPHPLKGDPGRSLQDRLLDPLSDKRMLLIVDDLELAQGAAAAAALDNALERLFKRFSLDGSVESSRALAR